MEFKAVITCVEYSDYLAITLPINKRFFDRIIVVTTPSDTSTQAICDMNSIEYLATDEFYIRGAKFNKGRAINLGLKQLEPILEWVVVLDADIILPHHTRVTLERSQLDPENLYGIGRRMIPNYNQWSKFVAKFPFDDCRLSDKHDVEAAKRWPLERWHVRQWTGYYPPGFFQLFNYGASVLKDGCAYPEEWSSAALSDIHFADKWPKENRRLLANIVAFHLDSNHSSMGANWSGRKTLPFTRKGASLKSKFCLQLSNLTAMKSKISLSWLNLSKMSARDYRLRFLLWKLKKQKIATVIYSIRFEYLFDTFEPIYKILNDETKLKIFFWCPKDKPTVSRALIKRGVPISQIVTCPPGNLAFDAFINAEINKVNFPQHPATKTIQIYHGTGTGPFSCLVGNLAKYDVHLVIGPQHLQCFANYPNMLKQKSRIYQVGYAKTDCLVNADNRSISELKTCDHFEKRTIVVYAPHWSPFGSLNQLGEELIEKVAEADALLILKLHDYIFSAAKDGYCVYPDWPARIARLVSRHKNIIVHQGSNTQDLYPLADVLITDAMSSVALEYCMTNRPLVVFPMHPHETFFRNRIVEHEVQRAGFVFRTAEEALRLTQRILNPDQEMQRCLSDQAKLQSEIVNKYLYNPGKAAPVAAAAILAELGILRRDLPKVTPILRDELLRA